MRNLLIACLVVLMLPGCAWLKGGEDNSVPPAELQKLVSQVHINQLWERHVGSGSKEQYVRLTPAVDDGRVFVADRDGQVSALDAETGKPLWSVDLKRPVSSGVGVGEGLVLVGTTEAEVIALNWSDGAEVWRSVVSSEVLGAPAAAEGTVVVQSVDGNVAGLDVASGERRWILDRTVPTLSLRGTSSPLLVRGGAITGFASGKLIAIELKRGLPVWEATIAVPRGRSELDRMVDIDSSPSIWGDQLYTVTYQGNVAAVDGANGQIAWSRGMSSPVGLDVDFRQVYVTDEDSNLWALDRRSGASMWKQTGLHNRALTRPAALGNYVAAADFEGWLHVFSRIDGEELARERIDSSGVLASPVVADDTLYVYTNGGTLAAYRVTQ